MGKMQAAKMKKLVTKCETEKRSLEESFNEERKNWAFVRNTWKQKAETKSSQLYMEQEQNKKSKILADSKEKELKEKLEKAMDDLEKTKQKHNDDKNKLT